jgi:hypothetical protein
MDAHDVPE